MDFQGIVQISPILHLAVILQIRVSTCYRIMFNLIVDFIGSFNLYNAKNGTYSNNQTGLIDKELVFRSMLRNPFRISGKRLGHLHPVLRSFLDV